MVVVVGGGGLGGGDGKFLLEMGDGGKGEMGEGVVMGGCEIFKVFLHS